MTPGDETRYRCTRLCPTARTRLGCARPEHASKNKNASAHSVQHVHPVPPKGRLSSLRLVRGVRVWPRQGRGRAGSSNVAPGVVESTAFGIRVSVEAISLKQRRLFVGREPGVFTLEAHGRTQSRPRVPASGAPPAAVRPRARIRLRTRGARPLPRLG
jgi:hypothetical protein